MDEDLVLALRIQKEWNLQDYPAQEPLSVVDPSWELVDPTPDLQALFVQFNDRFFWGQLEAVEVKWSTRMTVSTGICSYEGSGGLCSIRLSEPLLKLRPRKDLVETLLHEMIHAYLFVTDNVKDQGGHGPEFCKHMHRINRLSGANIKVYHTFHEEMAEYRRHWWRCNGPCRDRKPYYGYIKRATNRAPSAREHWWAEHQKTCGGTYIKVKEPENYSKKGKGKTELGKLPVSAEENKDKPNRGDTQLLIPFSGKGYVPGETSNSPSSGKFITSHAINETQDLLSQDHSAGALRPHSKVEVKFEQNGSSNKTSLVSPVLNTSHQNVLSNYYSRVSVDNQKAFGTVNGSPVRSVIVGDITKNSVSSSSQRRVTSSKIPLWNSLKAMEATSVTESQEVSGPEDGYPRKRSRLEHKAVFDNFFIKKEQIETESQEVSGPEDGYPRKRPRLEDKTVFDNFFIKKEQIQSGGSEPKSSLPSTAATQNSSTSPSQSQKVNCPVCQNEVLASEINEHLDWCLDGDSIEVKS